MKCPHCGFRIPSPQSLATKRKRERAIRWLIERRGIWEDRLVCRYAPMRPGKSMSPAWKDIALCLRAAGIYAKTYSLWDMTIDELVREARKRLRRGR